MSLAGEWQFNDTLVPPPANGQIRLNQTAQSLSTLMWVSRNSATGSDVSAALLGILPGQHISLENKSDPSKWQSYAVAGPAVAHPSYVEYPVTWLDGGVQVPQQRTLLYALPSGETSVPVGVMPLMQISTGSVEVIGHILRDDLVYPSDGPAGYSTGLTMRQWYATHAMQGLIAASPSNSNLIGTLPTYAFKIADSMLAFEAAEKAGATPPLAGSRRV